MKLLQHAHSALRRDLFCKALAAGWLYTLAACTPPTATTRNETQLREFSAHGYASTAHASFTTTRYTWTLKGQHVTIVLAQPIHAGATPVVVYLPGLGEPSDAGERWRQAWASAGYAVLSVQLLDDDANAWQSTLARNGEFKTLGRQHYAGDAMKLRVRALIDLVAEAQRRSAAGEAPWQRLDWNRLAIAGFDLGAYTAMAVAGEHVQDANGAVGPWPVRAIVALSPYASAAQGAFDTRYRDIYAPVMSVTSDHDGDALGLVEGAELRDAPFVHMTAPDKYLLTLHGLPHARLSGNVYTAAAKAESAAKRPPEGSEGKAGGGETGPHHHGQRGHQDAGAPSGHDRSDDDASGLTPAALQMGVIAAEDVSTAFLDTYLMDDPLARQWLQADAKPWLGAAGELRRK